MALEDHEDLVQFQRSTASLPTLEEKELQLADLLSPKFLSLIVSIDNALRV